MYRKSLLSNGLRVVTVPMPQVKSVAALVMVEAGSRYENKRNNGVSHFLEHMAFKGTKKRPSSLAISSLVDSIGASWNAFTAKDYTGFYIKAAAEHLDLILDVLSDNVLNSLFESSEIEKERKVIAEEINMYEDLPQERVNELFEQLLFDGNPLAMRISGTKETLAKIDRGVVTDYLHKMYHTRSVVVGIAGAIGGNALALAGKYFADLKIGDENDFERFEEKVGRARCLVYYKKTDQAHLCLGVRAYPRLHPDRYVLSVLATILGGNMSSRLFVQVREKRSLAYSIHAGAEEVADTGYFVAQAGLRLDAVSEAIRVIRGEFEKTRSKPISAGELRRAKDFSKGKMILALEDSFRVASFYTSQELLEEKIETPEEVLEKIEKVTAEDVQRVANDIFRSSSLNLALIGPFKDEEKFAKLLTI